MIDINKDKVEGEVMDILQGTCFRNPISIIAGDYEDAKDSDIVVITSGIARKPGQTRLELAQINVNIAKSISENIVKYAPDALYVIVANPVDIITYAFQRFTGLPKNRVIGSGTMLDTIRLRTRLAELYHVNQKQIHANVFGEHGDTSFVPWSVANISNVPIDSYHAYLNNSCIGAANYAPIDHDEVETFVKKSGGSVIAAKGATFYAVSLSVCHICKCLFTGADTTLTVSSMMHGEYGINDVCLSTLSIVGKDGLAGKLLLPLTDDEIAKLHKSAESLRAVIDGLGI
jgi:L-lactate dehydrogenase